jgi:ferredoxin
MKQYARSDLLSRIVKLQEKIDIEMKIYEAAEKLHLMYESMKNLDDKKMRTKVKDSLMESQAKIALLKSALNKYQSIERGQLKEEVESELCTQRQKSLKKKTVTGKLQGTISDVLLELKGIDVKKTEFHMVVQIDHMEIFRTKERREMSRSSWNEKFEVFLEKAYEIEFLLYNKGCLCALLFFPLQEWFEHSLLEQWNYMEPVGQLRLRLQIQRPSKEAGKNVTKKAVGRMQHVKKRKILEFFGHQLVSKRFYQILKCAVCLEMIIGRSCLQCEACLYACHVKCKERIFAKCISTSTADAEKEGIFRSYRIPHRFNEAIIGIPTFCCHCGYMLAIARRSKKCLGE